MSLERVIRKNNFNIALIIGNGINRYNSSRTTNSWDQLLLQLWNRHSHLQRADKIPKGISLTEFYDVLEMNQSEFLSSSSMQKEFCELMRAWTPQRHHKMIAEWAKEHHAPILTTNFENTLGESLGLKLQRKSSRKFTDYYPWESCYANEEVSDPANEFGIWHINGMQKYHRSIRLGLTHYMGSVERARNWFHKGNERRLFSGKNENGWRGSDTWLHVVFNKPLAIFGLELGQNEVFLRWLLIERAKYFAQFPDRKNKSWYFYVGDRQSPGKLLFLKSMGIEAVQVDTYDELYSSPWI